MSQLNSEGVAEFIRLVEELSTMTEFMSGHERKFIQDNFDLIDLYGDKMKVSEGKLDYIRQLYKRVM